jgi:hypothetical protein
LVEPAPQTLVEPAPQISVEHELRALVEQGPQAVVEKKPGEHAASVETPPLPWRPEQVIAERAVVGKVPPPPASGPGSGPFQVHHAHAGPFPPRPPAHAPLPGLVTPFHGMSPEQQPAGPGTRARRVMLWSGIAGAVAGTAAAAAIVLHTPGAARGQASPASASQTHGALPLTAAGYTRTQEGSKGTVASGLPYVSAVRAGVYQRAIGARPGAGAQLAGGLTSGMIRVETGRIAGASPASAIGGIYGNFKNQVDQASEGQAVVGAMRPFPAGSRGGDVRCWTVTVPSATGSPDSAGTSCLWADGNTFGYLFAPGMRISSLAGTLLVFRSVIETPAH